VTACLHWQRRAVAEGSRLVGWRHTQDGSRKGRLDEEEEEEEERGEEGGAG